MSANEPLRQKTQNSGYDCAGGLLVFCAHPELSAVFPFFFLFLSCAGRKLFSIYRWRYFASSFWMSVIYFFVFVCFRPKAGHTNAVTQFVVYSPHSRVTHNRKRTVRHTAAGFGWGSCRITFFSITDLVCFSDGGHHQGMSITVC